MDEATRILGFSGLIALLISGLFFAHQTMKTVNEAEAELERIEQKIEQKAEQRTERIITGIENKLGKSRDELIIKDTGNNENITEVYTGDEAYITEYDDDGNIIKFYKKPK